MGEQRLDTKPDREQLRAFMQALFDDLRALERMLDEGHIETGTRRIGAEQEMFLVDRRFEPAHASIEVLKGLDPAYFTTELALFNLEANLTPHTFGGHCLSTLEDEIRDLVGRAHQAAKELGHRVLLTGILPTLRKNDLGLESMTPKERYYQLNEAMTQLRGGKFNFLIKGLDELQTQHDNVMLEACNTSFQVHFQVGPGEFAKLYNLAQVVTAPVLAAAVNSPVLLGHRLWKETRVALFQQSVDARSQVQQARGNRTRVSFGDDWVKDSIIEIYREDVARFRLMLTTELPESPLEQLDRGEIPPLQALRVHTGTVYRWNRACYGVADGVPHLRIENRVLPAGPTILDEVANAAFFFGLMSALGDAHEDMREVMQFDHAHENFIHAARYGLKARFTWFGGEVLDAQTLILERLLPEAERGLNLRAIDAGDIQRYLGVIEARVRSGRTGAQWALESLAAMDNRGTKDARFRALTAALAEHQSTPSAPVHTWPLAALPTDGDHWRFSYRQVGQVMTTELFTVHPEDVVDLAANLMDWQHIRHVPVENEEGHLVGLVTHRSLLRLIGRRRRADDRKAVPVRDIMRTKLVTVSPETSSLEAISLMRTRGVSCLPVVDGDQLVGIVTEADFIEVAAKLLEASLEDDST